MSQDFGSQQDQPSQLAKATAAVKAEDDHFHSQIESALTNEVLDAFFHRESTQQSAERSADGGSMSFCEPSTIVASLPYQSKSGCTILSKNVFDEATGLIDTQYARLLLFLLMMDGTFPAWVCFTLSADQKYKPHRQEDPSRGFISGRTAI